MQQGFVDPTNDKGETSLGPPGSLDRPLKSADSDGTFSWNRSNQKFCH